MLLRMMHGCALIREVARYARLNRAWWLLVVLPFVIVAMLGVGAAETVVPYTVYTLF